MSLVKCTTLTVIIPAYQSEHTILPTLDSVRSQNTSGLERYEILIVNDGSTDTTTKLVDQINDPRIKLIHLKKNQGRAMARNVGVEKSTSSHLIFLDSDCVFAHRACIQNYVHVFNQGFLACFGAVTARGQGFWYRYQRSNYHKRVKHGDLLSLVTSQNFGIKKAVIDNIGGFNPNYRRYGFEDRDLYLRILSHVSKDRIKQDPQLIVYHIEALTLLSVCNKMETAGRYTAKIFKDDHPDYYHHMVYSKLDAALMQNQARSTFQLLLKGYDLLFRLSDLALDNPIIPYLFREGLVKLVCALSFFKGSIKQNDNRNRQP